MATATSRTAGNLSTVTTLIDGVVEILRGRRRSGALLLAAAVLSRKLPGIGTAASVMLREYRKLR